MSAPSKPHIKHIWLSVAVILGIMTLLALNFPKDSFWYDEALTTYVATDSWETLWRWSTEVDIQVPFHYVALRLWAGVVGDSEFALRSLSALSILVAAGGMIAIGKRVTPRTGAGQVAAALLGLLPGVLWIAYEVRAYAWGVWLYTWATAFLVHALTARRITTARIIGYGLLMAGALYTHYTALAGLAAHGVIVGVAALLMIARRTPIEMIVRLCAPILLAALLFAPWLPIVRARGAADRSYYPGSIPIDQSIHVAAAFKALGQQDLPPLPTAAALGTGYLVLVAVGLAAGLGFQRTRRAALVALPLTVVPLSAVVILLLANPKLTGRYFWAAWIGADLLIALALVALTRYRTVLAVGLAVVLSAIPYLTGERGESPNSDFRGAFATICRDGSPDDVILLRDGTLFVAARYYLARPPCHAPRQTFGMPEALIPDVTRLLDLGAAQSVIAEIARMRPPNVWVVAWQGDVMESQGLAYGLLDGIVPHTVINQPFGDVRLDRYTFGHEAEYERLGTVASAGILSDPSAEWYNLRALPDGAALIALRLIAPPTVHNGDVITLQAWWERGTFLQPSLRVSARLTTLDNGWVYTQIDQPPSAWKNVDDRWTPGVPVLGRYELRVGEDIPAGEVALRYVIYDTNNAFDPIVITVARLRVE
ncbi:MAG TPA: hypothetical protein PLD47_00730 [Aggregatilineales bacterium]|nr:hypothetical protein [Anaerolineales bacterium]HRE46224.1 hypothetical protein [Aggregatilineales bacterium]